MTGVDFKIVELVARRSVSRSGVVDGREGYRVGYFNGLLSSSGQKT